MTRPIPLRDDFSADDLRQLARKTHDARQAQRLLAIASVYAGLPRAEAAQHGAMSARTLAGWIHAFNAEGAEGLINTPPPGRPSKLSAAQKQNISDLVEAGPDPEVDGVVRWRCVDLKAIIHQRYDVDLDEATVGRLLKELGFAHVSARPQHPRQDPEAIESFKKNAPGACCRDNRDA